MMKTCERKELRISLEKDTPKKMLLLFFSTFFLFFVSVILLSLFLFLSFLFQRVSVGKTIW